MSITGWRALAVLPLAAATISSTVALSQSTLINTDQETQTKELMSDTDDTRLSVGWLWSPDAEADLAIVAELEVFRRRPKAEDRPPAAVAEAARQIASEPGAARPSDSPEVVSDSGRRLVQGVGRLGDMYGFILTNGDACYVFDDGTGSCISSFSQGVSLSWTEVRTHASAETYVYGLAEDFVEGIIVELTDGRLVPIQVRENAFASRLPPSVSVEQFVRFRVEPSGHILEPPVGEGRFGMSG